MSSVHAFISTEPGITLRRPAGFEDSAQGRRGRFPSSRNLSKLLPLTVHLAAEVASMAFSSLIFEVISI